MYNTAKMTASSAALVLSMAGAQASAQEAWDWNAAIYLWGATIGTDTKSGASTEITFDTLLENLNSGAMAAVAANRGPWTIFGDFIYLNVNGSKGGTLNFGPGPGVDADADVRLAGFISTVGAGYEVADGPGYGVNVLGGIRYLWLESEFDATVGPARVGDEGDESSIDAVVGVRGSFDLSDKWYLTYYADVGAGQSELTWQALASANYRFDNWDLSVGYRHGEWEFDDFGPFERLSVGGPFAGARFSF